MIGVDKIGKIRRAYFEQSRSIKEIVRTFSVSRATLRKVIRGHKTEFTYARGVQPTPKLGDWDAGLAEVLEAEAKLPKRERRSTQRLFEELRARGDARGGDLLDGRHVQALRHRSPRLARRHPRAHRRASRRQTRRSVAVELARRGVENQSRGLTCVPSEGVMPPVLGGCVPVSPKI